MAKLWSSIKIPLTQLCLAASVPPGKLNVLIQVADLEGVVKCVSWADRNRKSSKGRSKRLEICHMPLATGVSFRTITEENILFYCVSNSYQKVPRLKRIDASFHGAYVRLKYSNILLLIKILNNNVHLTIEKGAICTRIYAHFHFSCSNAR